MQKRIAVVCGSEREFNELIVQNVYSDDRHMFYKVTRMDHIRGMKFSVVIRGSSYNSYDLDGIYEAAQTRVYA